MKAILFDIKGFRKDMQIAEIVPVIRQANMERINLVPSMSDPSEPVPMSITDYYLVREFFDEYDMEVLVYRERP